MDRYFSSPKAGTMQDMCRTALNNPDAWIDAVCWVRAAQKLWKTGGKWVTETWNYRDHFQADTFNCKTMICKRRDASNPNVIWMHSVSPIDNIQCGNGGRCFRGKCRPESKLLKNEGSGYCMTTSSRIGFTVLAQMFICPASKYISFPFFGEFILFFHFHFFSKPETKLHSTHWRSWMFPTVNY